MDVFVRAATSKDFPVLQDIERAAGRLFAEIGLDEIADDDPPSLEELSRYADGGLAWVLAQPDVAPIGYALVDVVDGCAHVEQLSVHPDQHRHGYGRMLIEHIATWARERAMPAVTLTTFKDVPWNAPYYERCGFHTLAETELGPDLAAVRAHETQKGLDPRARVCMRLDLGGSGGLG